MSNVIYLDVPDRANRVWCALYEEFKTWREQVRQLDDTDTDLLELISYDDEEIEDYFQEQLTKEQFAELRSFVERYDAIAPSLHAPTKRE